MGIFAKLMTTAAVGLSLAGATVLPSVAQAGWFSCQANEVLELSNRVHIRCSNSVSLNGDTVRYVAIDKSNASEVARFISMGTAAVMAGQIFRVYVPTSSVSNTAGCLTSDCRTPTAFGVMR